MSSDIQSLLKDIQSLSQQNQSKLYLELRSITLEHLGDEALVDEETASGELFIAPATLSIWRCTGRYNLPFHKIGRLVRYKMGDLRAFTRSRRIGPLVTAPDETEAGARLQECFVNGDSA
jgi:hypothetical protein